MRAAVTAGVSRGRHEPKGAAASCRLSETIEFALPLAVTRGVWPPTPGASAATSIVSRVPGGANRGDADEKAADWRMHGANVARSRGLELRADTVDGLAELRNESPPRFGVRAAGAHAVMRQNNVEKVKRPRPKLMSIRPAMGVALSSGE